MSDDASKAAARARVAALVQGFRRNEADYLRAVYNETQARTDFITPLLEAFGWDVHNSSGHPPGLREVVEEATVDVGDERLSKKPDYELRLARQRKLFVDRFYNSGLFHLMDDARLGIRIGDDVLAGIIGELYYPQSPYTFAVVETEVLGEIYEQFLGEVIAVEAGAVRIVSKPEVREAGGVVPTPRYVADTIVQRTLGPALAGKAPADLTTFTVADICCGSGIFLLAAYEFLLDHYLAWYVADGTARHAGTAIYEGSGGQWRLLFEEKRRILLAHIRGVDIDANAVEVARFSLLLKLIEDETGEALRDYVARRRRPALPALDTVLRPGNSLVSAAEWVAVRGAMPPVLLQKVNPLTWSDEFPVEMARGGFDAIVGNPPYIRIQTMMAYSPEEATYYQDAASPYRTARQDNFDKYALFVERALALLRSTGRLGVIVPHKFMTIQAGRAVRELIADSRGLEQVVHFGVQQVFGRQASNYTCLLILDRRGVDVVRVERVGALEAWRYGDPGDITTIPVAELGADAWQFADTATRDLFARVRAAHPVELDDLAEIFVGVQTSADAVYIFKPVAETEEIATLRWGGRDWPIERGVLRPCMLDAQLLPYSRAEANRWMIFPYELVRGARRTEARLMQPEELERRYPGCWAYLLARRAELERRSITGGTEGTRQFYQFGRSQSLTKFDSPKIILPILSLEARYAYDEANITVTGGGNGPYYMIRPRPGARESNAFLLAILHHPLCEAMVRTNTSTFRGGYYSHGKQFIERLPVPAASDAERTEIEDLVRALIAANDAAKDARTPHQRILQERSAAALREQVEACVSKLFGLSPEDVALLRAVPVPT